MFGVYGFDEDGFVFLMAEDFTPAKSFSAGMSFSENHARRISDRYSSETGRAVFIMEKLEGIA